MNPSNAKRVTRNQVKPGIRPLTVQLDFDTEKEPITAGFRQNWIDGENSDNKINLSCGAGLGTPYMVFSLTNKKTGKTRWAVADVRQMVNALAEALG